MTYKEDGGEVVMAYVKRLSQHLSGWITYINPLEPSSNCRLDAALTVGDSTTYIYGFHVILTTNSDYVLKQL
jgi:hypothetical protein